MTRNSSLEVCMLHIYTYVCANNIYIIYISDKSYVYIRMTIHTYTYAYVYTCVCANNIYIIYISDKSLSHLWSNFF